MSGVEFRWDVRSAEPGEAGARQTPGTDLFGTLTVTPGGEIECSHLYLRLGWRTGGRSMEESGVAAEADLFQGTLAAGQPAQFAFRLPAPDRPWSFAGRVVAILWELTAEIDRPLAVNPRSRFPILLRPETK